MADATGTVTVRGFKGDYDVAVVSAGATNHSSLSLAANRTITATVPVSPPAATAGFAPDGRLTLSWPAASVGYRVEFATSLTPPLVWQPVATTPELLDGAWRLNLPATPGDRYYRLNRAGN